MFILWNTIEVTIKQFIDLDVDLLNEVEFHEI